MSSLPKSGRSNGTLSNKQIVSAVAALDNPSAGTQQQQQHLSSSSSSSAANSNVNNDVKGGGGGRWGFVSRLFSTPKQTATATAKKNETASSAQANRRGRPDGLIESMSSSSDDATGRRGNGERRRSSSLASSLSTPVSSKRHNNGSGGSIVDSVDDVEESSVSASSSAFTQSTLAMSRKQSKRGLNNHNRTTTATAPSTSTSRVSRLDLFRSGGKAKANHRRDDDTSPSSSSSSSLSSMATATAAASQQQHSKHSHTGVGGGEGQKRRTASDGTSAIKFATAADDVAGRAIGTDSDEEARTSSASPSSSVLSSSSYLSSSAVSRRSNRNKKKGAGRGVQKDYDGNVDASDSSASLSDDAIVYVKATDAISVNDDYANADERRRRRRREGGAEGRHKRRKRHTSSSDENQTNRVDPATKSKSKGEDKGGSGINKPSLLSSMWNRTKQTMSTVVWGGPEEGMLIGGPAAAAAGGGVLVTTQDTVTGYGRRGGRGGGAGQKPTEELSSQLQQVGGGGGGGNSKKGDAAWAAARNRKARKDDDGTADGTHTRPKRSMSAARELALIHAERINLFGNTTADNSNISNLARKQNAFGGKGRGGGGGGGALAVAGFANDFLNEDALKEDEEAIFPVEVAVPVTFGAVGNVITAAEGVSGGRGRGDGSRRRNRSAAATSEIEARLVAQFSGAGVLGDNINNALLLTNNTNNIVNNNNNSMFLNHPQGGNGLFRLAGNGSNPEQQQQLYGQTTLTSQQVIMLQQQQLQLLQQQLQQQQQQQQPVQQNDGAGVNVVTRNLAGGEDTINAAPHFVIGPDGNLILVPAPNPNGGGFGSNGGGAIVLFDENGNPFLVNPADICQGNGGGGGYQSTAPHSLIDAIRLYKSNPSDYHANLCLTYLSARGADDYVTVEELIEAERNRFLVRLFIEKGALDFNSPDVMIELQACVDEWIGEDPPIDFFQRVAEGGLFTNDEATPTLPRPPLNGNTTTTTTTYQQQRRGNIRNNNAPDFVRPPPRRGSSSATGSDGIAVDVTPSANGGDGGDGSGGSGDVHLPHDASENNGEYIDGTMADYLRVMFPARHIRITAAQQARLYRSGFEFGKLMYDFPHIVSDIPASFFRRASWVNVVRRLQPLLLVLTFCLMCYDHATIGYILYQWNAVGSSANFQFYLTIIVYVAAMVIMSIAIFIALKLKPMTVYSDDGTIVAVEFPSHWLKLFPMLLELQICNTYYRELFGCGHGLGFNIRERDGSQIPNLFLLHDLWALMSLSHTIHSGAVTVVQLLIQSYYFSWSLEDNGTAEYDDVARGYLLLQTAAWPSLGIAFVMHCIVTSVFYCVTNLGFVRLSSGVGKKTMTIFGRMIGIILLYLFICNIFFLLVAVFNFDTCSTYMIIWVSLAGVVVLFTIIVFSYTVYYSGNIIRATRWLLPPMLCQAAFSVYVSSTTRDDNTEGEDCQIFFLVGGNVNVIVGYVGWGALLVVVGVWGILKAVGLYRRMRQKHIAQAAYEDAQQRQKEETALAQQHEMHQRRDGFGSSDSCDDSYTGVANNNEPYFNAFNDFSGANNYNANTVINQRNSRIAGVDANGNMRGCDGSVAPAEEEGGAARGGGLVAGSRPPLRLHYEPSLHSTVAPNAILSGNYRRTAPRYTPSATGTSVTEQGTNAPFA